MITEYNQLVNAAEYWTYQDDVIKQITPIKPGFYNRDIDYWFTYDSEGYRDRLYLDVSCPLFESLKELIQYYHPEYFE